ncbi:DUF3291 domain-containing protein [Leucobacter sp. M11]|uniref:DUF3291 domain-containing protein n=1 Tax=Leucobacter sp. M11 TaxID=2993565 RepID=UPI002D7EC9BC|nr:DUF3291 domain-containing protein [Leucobacter sp. M11]MEB4615273.1 DUF3291 domain-containing protein [Leucobacter sp. M11]
MVTLVWHPTAPLAAGTVMASRFLLSRRRSVPGFLIASLRIWRSVRRAPGCRAAALRAQPLARTFWTISVWETPEALRRYAAGPGHAVIAQRQRPRAAESDFAYWQSAAGLPDWAEAEHRIERVRVLREP